MTITTVEAFLTDSAFLDRSRIINEFLIEEDNLVCAMTPKAFSYFKNPKIFQDSRPANSRNVTWTAETVPSIVVDEFTYSGFVDTVNNLPPSTMVGFFKIVDILAFSYFSGNTRSQIEEMLNDDADVVAIYVPDSFVNSATINEVPVYQNLGTTQLVDVPSFVRFSIKVLQGSTEVTYTITLYTSVSAWLTGYDVSTIVKIIPPLPYDKLYSSLINGNEASIFQTASTTAVLSYNSMQNELGTVSVSGVTIYQAVLTDAANNTISVPFNIIFKGRRPTLSEIRAAIRSALLTSGIGDAAGWEARIPGVFIAGRFYIVPFWDLYIEKPDQVVYPSIIDYTVAGEKTNQILESTGFGDLRENMDVLSIYYDNMILSAVPDLTGVIEIQKLNSVIPDYQNFSPNDENFAYMDELTQEFSLKVNQSIALNVASLPSDEIPILNENLLSFYSFVVGRYEMCVITKECYTAIMESIQ